MKRFRSGIQGDRDVHSRLMQAYPEVPRWWYALVGLVSLLMGIVAVELFPTQLPIWGLLVAIVIPACWCLPIAMIKAVTNQDVFLNVIAELIPGYILPHKPVANMISKALGTIVSARAIAFLGDLKLGHYMKIPPRTMFIAQLAASAITCVVSMLVQQWMFSSVADICTPDQKGGFSCPSTHTFATASLVWGGIGPAKLFSPGAL
jgi:OPT family oligopeptide transporter